MAFFHCMLALVLNLILWMSEFVLCHLKKECVMWISTFIQFLNGGRFRALEQHVGEFIIISEGNWGVKLSSVQFSSVTQSCPTLCDPMNRSTPGFPVHHHLPEFTQTHVHRVSDAIQPSHPVVPFSSCPQSLPASESFPMSQLFAWGQSIRVSALASVLPMNTQDRSPLGWTDWISLQSKGLSRVFSNTIVQKHQFFGTQLSLTSIHDHWKNHSLD